MSEFLRIHHNIILEFNQGQPQENGDLKVWIKNIHLAIDLAEIQVKNKHIAWVETGKEIVNELLNMETKDTMFGTIMIISAKKLAYSMYVDEVHYSWHILEL